VAYSAEAAHVLELDALEPAPPPGCSPGDGSHPDTVGDPRTYTSAYAAGLRVLRVSLADDYDDGPPPLVEDDSDEEADEDNLAPVSIPVAAWGGTTSGPVPPSLAFLAAPAAGAPLAPASVSAARRLPDFDAPNGWRRAIGGGLLR
jgi:hypothetical protein